jgi:hypothetical protein
VNSNSRSCVTKQLVASNRRKRGRHHVAKRFLSHPCSYAANTVKYLFINQIMFCIMRYIKKFKLENTFKKI